MPSGWDTSTRRSHVTNGWQQQRDNKRILARHRGICHVCGKPGATEVDHIIPLHLWPAGNIDSNKRPIHPKPCHADKTSAESTAARTLAPRRRPTEPHPGLTPGG